MTQDTDPVGYDPALLLRDQTLYTDRTILLPVELGDESFLHTYMADPAISRHMSWSPHETMDETAQVVRTLVDNRHRGIGITWCIYLRDSPQELESTFSARSDAFAGIFSLIGIVHRHRSLRYDKAELAYWLAPDCQSRGLMTEVGHAVLARAFGELRLHKLVVGHMDINERSRGLIERLGFRFVGTERQHFKKAGAWHDHHIYELLVSDSGPAAS